MNEAQKLIRIAPKNKLPCGCEMPYQTVYKDSIYTFDGYSDRGGVLLAEFKEHVNLAFDCCGIRYRQNGRWDFEESLFAPIQFIREDVENELELILKQSKKELA